jgi:ornithine cyclodeaminase
MSSDTVLILNNDDVERVFDVDACLDVLERAYRAQADGSAVDRARTQSYVKLPETDIAYCLKTMEGAVPGTGLMALRLTSDIVSEAKVNGMPRREKLPRGPGATYCGLIVLFDISRLTPVAIVHDGFIQIYRVACSSALSSRLLANEDACELGLLGSSGQAWAHLVATNAVRKLKRVRVYSPNPHNRGAFAARASAHLDIEVLAAESAREAIEGASLVVAATNTSDPIVDGRWLAPGAHVVSIVSGDQKQQRRELDDETYRRAAVVITHSKKLAQEQNQGDLIGPVDAGIIAWDRIFDLSDLVAGRSPCRASRADITVFKNNVGLGLQFAAVAPTIYERARALGIGREIPAEWFLQKMKP